MQERPLRGVLPFAIEVSYPLPVPLGDDGWNKTVIKMVARMVVMLRSDQRQVKSNMRIQQIWVCACGLAQDQRE